MDISLPTSWNQIPIHQLRQVIALFGQQIDRGALLAKAFLLLAPLKLREWYHPELDHVYHFETNDKTIVSLNAMQVLSAADTHLSFLLEASDVVENPIPVITIGRGCRRRKTKSAAGLLSDCSWAQYKFAENFLTLFLQTKQTEYRNMFIASLYTDKLSYSDNGIIRKGYHYEMGQENRHKLFAHVSDVDFQILLLYWNGTQEYLKKAFKNLYSSTEKKVKHSDAYADNAKNIVTIMDRLKCSESEVYTAHHTTVLEVLDRMVYESKEIEKIRNKK